MIQERKALAERFFRGVYSGDPSVVDELAGEDIAATYPVFDQIFNTPTLRGRQAVKNFSIRFASRWADRQLTIHEAIAEGQHVVLVWSFQAKNVASLRPGEPPTNQVQRWGGISLFRFDESGKIVAEIGEESVPGPIERLNVSQDT